MAKGIPLRWVKRRSLHFFPTLQQRDGSALESRTNLIYEVLQSKLQMMIGRYMYRKKDYKEDIMNFVTTNNLQSQSGKLSGKIYGLDN